MILISDAKRKRGRPSVNERMNGIVDAFAETDARDQTHRSHVNQVYTIAASNFIGEHVGEVEHADKLVFRYKDSYIPAKKGHAVLEQIGRMIEQDRFSDDDVLAVSIYAASMLDAGYTVKQTAEWVRQGRRSGFKKVDILEADSEISLSYKEIVLAAKYFEILRSLIEILEQSKQLKRDDPITFRYSGFNLDAEQAILTLAQLQRKFENKIQ